MANRGYPVVKSELSDYEKEKLILIASRRTARQQDAHRARIILGCADGLSNREVARRKRVS